MYNSLTKPFRPNSFMDRLYPKEYAMGHHGNSFTSFPVGGLDDTGLVAWYDFRETSGDLINHSASVDKMSNGDLTTGGSITKTANAWDFTSTDGFADNGQVTSALASTFSAWTINFWGIPASVRTANTAILTAFDGNTNNFQAVNMTAGGKAQGIVGDNGNQKSIESSTSYSTSVTQMMTAVYDGSLSGTDRLRFYFNGTSESTASGTPDASYTLNAYPSIGKQGDSTQPFYTGVMNDVSFWSRALSAAEVTTLFNGGTPLPLA